MRRNPLSAFPFDRILSIEMKLKRSYELKFVAPQSGQISVIGLRAKSGGRLTTMPVLTK